MKKLGNVSWLFHHSGFRVFVNKAPDECFVRFVAALRTALVEPDGRIGELFRDEVIKEQQESKEYANKKRAREDSYVQNAMDFGSTLSNVASERKSSK